MVQVVRGFGALYFSCPVSTQQANSHFNGASHKMGQHIVRTPTGVPLCVRVSRVSRVCPGSPRCLFTGTGNPKKGRRKDPSRSYKADCADSCNEVSLSQSGFHHRLRSARTSSVSHVTHARHESRES